MITRLDKPLRREIHIGGEPYVVTLTPEALLLTEKGRRKGLQLPWTDLVSGDAALATALKASLHVPQRARRPAPQRKSPTRKPRLVRSR